MSKDYKRRISYRKKTKRKSSFLGLWLFVLLLFVVFTLGLVYLGKQKQHLNSLTDFIPKNTATTYEQSKTETIITAKVAPKFAFYKSSQRKVNEGTSEYELEIATVKSYAAADHLKAELTLFGLATSITPIRKQEMQQYQVSVGPYYNYESAVAAMKKLKQNKISSNLKKIR